MHIILEVVHINKKTNKIDESLEHRLMALKSYVDVIRKRLNKYPKGNLKIKRVKGKTYYCVTDENSSNQRYIKVSDLKAVQDIAQRDYDLSYLSHAEKEIRDIERILSKNYFARAKDCYSSINEGRKSLVKPFEMSDEDYIKKWLAISYDPKVFIENDTTEYYTEKGERVRSKSEIIIANMLKELNIPYKYECPIRLGSVTMYPDFTILDVNERREKYLEHFGMMGDLDYVSNMMLKIATYEQNDIFIGDKLICTFESAKRPLNVSALKRKLSVLL